MNPQSGSQKKFLLLGTVHLAEVVSLSIVQKEVAIQEEIFSHDFQSANREAKKILRAKIQKYPCSNSEGETIYFKKFKGWLYEVVGARELRMKN